MVWVRINGNLFWVRLFVREVRVYRFCLRMYMWCWLSRLVVCLLSRRKLLKVIV